VRAAWKPIEGVPEAFHGTYGSGTIYAPYGRLTIDGEGVHPSDGDPSLRVVEAAAFEGRSHQIVLRKASFGDRMCRGTLELTEGNLVADLESVDEDGSIRKGLCPRVSGTRWSVETARLPQRPIDNGKVVIAVEGDRVKVSTRDEQGLRCDQRILQTATRSTTDAGRDRIPVGAGEVVMLEPAEPTAGVRECDDRLRTLATNRCSELLGMPCDDRLLEGFHVEGAGTLSCPSHVVVGEPTPSGRKVALLPQTIPNAVCFEMSGNFQ
jgi:hypothetical protein